MKTQPLVSIGLPVYNGELFLAEALESLLQQTFTDFEIIISDNASTDQTKQICQDYATKDGRIRYYRSGQNRGAAWNFNRTFELARSPYFKWAAHDNLCASTYLEACVNVLDSDVSIVLCHAQTVLVDCESQRLQFEPSLDCFVDPLGNRFRKPGYSSSLNAAEPHQRYKDLLFSVRWCFEVFGLIRTDMLKRTSLIGSYYGSDKVLLAELILLGRFYTLFEDLFFRRCHANQSSTLNSTVEREAWINSRAAKNLIFPRFTCLLGYLQAVTNHPLSTLESLYCLMNLALWSVNGSNWRRFILELKREAFGTAGS